LTNISNSGTYQLYAYAVLNNSNGAYNRSVVLTENPKLYLNSGQQNDFNNGAVDPDGDSVVVSLTGALSAANSPIPYNPGFSAAAPITSQPSMTVAPATGQVAVNPVGIGSDVVVYRFDEYRNGVLIGSTIRDIQVTVINSTNTLPALSIPALNSGLPLQACVGDTLLLDMVASDVDGTDSVVFEVSGAGLGASAYVMHSFFGNPSGGTGDSARVMLVTDQSMIGNGVMYVTVRDGACPFEGARTYAVLISVQSCGSGCSYTYAADTVNPMLYHFVASPSGSGNLVSWTFGDGVNATGTSVSHVYTIPGVYVVCMNEMSGNTIVCSQCVSLIVDSAGPCGINAVDLSNHQFLFQVANQSAGVTATWDFGDGQTGWGTSVTHTYASGGQYNVCVVLSDSAGTQICTSCTSVTDSSAGCAISVQMSTTVPYTAILSVPAYPGAVSYTWDMGNGNTASGPIVTYTFPVNGTYNICVTISGGGAILCQSCTTLVVGPPPSPCSASFTAVSNLMTAFFIDQSSGFSGGAAYQWDFGDQSSSTVRFPQHTYSVPGTYNVCLTVSDSGCGATFCDYIVVDTNFNVNPVCMADFVTIQLAPYQLAVVNLSNGVNLSFNWDFGDGTTANQPYPSHVYASTGTYYLCLTVSDAGGCSDTFCDTVSVDSTGNLVRSATGFSINVVSPASLTGISNPDAIARFSCHPNPFSDVLYLDLPQEFAAETEYRILSVQGLEVGKGVLQRGISSIDATYLASGLYLLELSEGGHRYCKRIIKQ
jgi:PKD repeat protein